MAAPHQEKDVPAAADEQPEPVVYQRSSARQIRVLDTTISRLELQLNGEMEKIPSCSELLEEIIAKPRGSPCSGLREELDKARAKRDKVYLKRQLEIQQAWDDNNGDGGAAPPAAADEAAPPPVADDAK